MSKSLLDLGRTVATPGAIAEMEKAKSGPAAFIERHVTGDWGCVSAADKKMNEEALTDGSRIFSAYMLSTGIKIWVITTATDDSGNRESTCILTPDEY